jgi:putative endonuclease
MEHHYCVYILASQRNGTLYIGVTNDLKRRVWEHKHDCVEGFTKRYGVHEQTSDVRSAIVREKQLKKWKREWKLNLIEESNPTWNDLYAEL